MASNQQLTKPRQPRIGTPQLFQRPVGSQSNGGGGPTSLLDFTSSSSSSSSDRVLRRKSNKSINNSFNKSTGKRKSNTNDSLVVPKDDTAKVQRQRTSMTLRNRNEFKAADDDSIGKALGGQRRRGGGAVRRGGSSKKRGGVKKSGGSKMAFSFLVDNLHTMNTNTLYKANQDFGCATRCQMSKKSNNGSGFKACECLATKACNVTNLEDFIAYCLLSESERELLGPPGSAGTCKLLLFITHLYHMIIYSFCSHIISPSILL